MSRISAAFALLAAIAFATAPFLSEGFNGFAADRFPVPQNDPPVQPAGYAFAIWGVIYLWLIAGTGFGLLARAADTDWRAARPPLVASLAVGSAWIAVAQVSVVWATVLIWVMLATALAALLRAGATDRWWQREPLGAYAGWLTAASCVSIGLLLGGYGIVPGTVAAVIALLLALAIAAVVQRARADCVAYPAAVVWALAGVIVSNLSPVDPVVLGLAAIGIAYLAVAALRSSARRGTVG